MSKEIIQRLILNLQEYLEDLKPSINLSREDQIKNKYEIERLVQLCVDTSMSISKKVLLEKGKKVPRTCKETFLFLGDEGFLTKELSIKLSHSCGLRNILVHEYTELKTDYFLDGLKSGHKTFVDFIDQIESIIRK